METALSRYPVHRLAKHGDIAIDIRAMDESGNLSTKWEVTHNSKYGQPGPLAYKFDTIIINRRIEETPRPVPKIIRLGSLREITEELGISTHATGSIRRALLQNAGALISTKTRYRRADGAERTLEADFTRYSVVLTGEELPDGRKADAVYIVLNDIYMQVINGAMTRPLDYDYLKSLPPAPQRFYELLSYRMYAAIKNDRPRAKLLYSELCTYAPLVRQANWNVIRPQLARIHAPHQRSGYIARIDFNEVVDREGGPDWELLYQPGPKARAEFRAFTRRGGPVVLEVEPLAADPLPRPAPAGPPSPLEAALIGHGITPAVARQLVAEHGEDAVRVQLEHLAWQVAKRPGKIVDPAAWLVSAIKTGHAAPKGFVSRAEQQRRQEARQAEERQAAEERRRRREEEARRRAEDAAVVAYRRALAADELARHEADAVARADPEWRQAYQSPSTPPRLKTAMRSLLVHEHLRHLLKGGPNPAAET